MNLHEIELEVTTPAIIEPWLRTCANFQHLFHDTFPIIMWLNKNNVHNIGFRNTNFPDNRPQIFSSLSIDEWASGSRTNGVQFELDWSKVEFLDI